MAERYLHIIKTWRGGELRQVDEIHPGTEPVTAYECPNGLSTTKRIQVEPDGSLSSVVLFGNEEVRKETIRRGSTSRFFLAGSLLRPTIMVETVMPA
jgi:hypothetical protein